MNHEKKYLSAFVKRFGQCVRCGSAEIVITELQSTGKLYARPVGSNPITIFTSGVLVNGLVCLECGHLEMLINPNKAKTLVNGVQAGSISE